MHSLSRENLKVLFEHVKHFRISEGFDDIDFESIYYYSWLDQTDNVLYMIYHFEDKITGIKWKAFRLPSKPLGLGLCDICKKHRKRGELISISAETEILPKNVTYRTKGFHVCIDYKMCNADLRNTERLDLLFSAILT